MSRTILSTKILTVPQQQLLLHSGLGYVHYDILKIAMVEYMTLDSSQLEQVIITSQNALPAITSHLNNLKKIYCVGSVTAQRLEELGIVPQVTTANALELAHYLVQHFPDHQFTYLCGNRRRDDLPDVFYKHKVKLKEVIVYESAEVVKSFDRIFAAVLFYSPRGVYAFAKANKHQPQCSICIGDTTAAAARELYENVLVATKQTVENVLVTAIKKLRDDKK